jgi:hypothetical protein
MTVRASTRNVALAGAGAAMIAVLAGCGQQPTTGSTPTPSPSTVTGASSSPVPDTSEQDGSGQSTENSTPTPSPENPSGGAQEGMCDTEDLELSLEPADAAAGTTYMTLLFKNTSGESCVVQGYPGVSYVTGEDQHQVGKAAYRVEHEGPPVNLAPGETAHADIGMVQVRNYDAGDCDPQKVTGIRVYPPHETEPTIVDYSGTGCASEDIPGQQLTVRTIEPGTA